LIINENKTYLVAVSTGKALYYCDLNDLFSETNKKSTVEFEILLENYHSDSITSIDTNIRKTLVATCSVDRSLTLWNYDANSVELRQHFDEDLLSVAMHPSGMYLLLGTTNSLKYMSIFTDKLQVLVVYNVRSCSNCLFAHGGHEFVTVHGTVVQVYSTLAHKEIRSVKTQDMGKIKQLVLSKNDHYLMCCSMAGIVRIWDMTSLVLVTEIVTKGLSYIGLSLHPNQEWLFLISTEKAIRQFQLPKADDCKKVSDSRILSFL
jgi:WD40 repeat protein